MFRIVALNQDGVDGELDEEVGVTKEAQETIAESEYVRAIQYKFQGRSDLALLLLKELLATKVIDEISTDGKNDKLWAIRYNCHKNLGIIYEEKEDFQMALQNYIAAMKIDDNDVYTMHRFGQLALKTNALELAELAFTNCLRHNPSHWSAADGILQTLCRNHNILGAYGWAVKLYRSDHYYEPAVKTLKEIITKFKSLIPFFEKCKGPLNFVSTSIASQSKEVYSVFPEVIEKCDECVKKPDLADLKKYRLNSLNWFTVGQYIVSIYNYLKTEEQGMLFVMNFDDIVNDSNTISNNKELPENTSCFPMETSPDSSSSTSYATFKNPTESNSQTSDNKEILAPNSSETKSNQLNTPDGTEDNNSGTKTDKTDAQKPKPRRRCSDLNFLEQWGWHKNRRYSSRKKAPQDRAEIDTTLNGFLQRVFTKFTATSFETDWPFSLSDKLDGTYNIGHEKNGPHLCEECEKSISMETFQEKTRIDFNMFLLKLKGNHFDLTVLTFRWLKYVSMHWDMPLPSELKSLYLDIYALYFKHFDFSTWNQLSNKNLEASYRICLLFLELEYAEKVNDDCNLSTAWRSTFNHLLFQSGCTFITLGKYYDEYKLRLVNLEYLWNNFCNQLQRSFACLEHMEEIITRQSEHFVLHLPNLNKACITDKFVFNSRLEVQRQIALNKISNLYEEKKWPEIITIIIDNVVHIQEMPECENWLKDFKVQMEILLQSLWNTSAYEDCLLWSERFFQYSALKYVIEGKSSCRQKVWVENINFTSSYIEAMILNEGFDILSHLGDMLSRLVQYIIRILSYEFDGLVEKNNSNASAFELETKPLWVILHQIMLREENNNPALIKMRSDESEDEDYIIPNSLMVLFTAHEFLGKRQLCTRTNGSFLHYILDAVAPNLRAPIYDACRDAIYEYVEQVTYCLYGHPPKKARSRHLEDHEASPIELTWCKAIQIFDLYRPDCLPEFNSYKLESISSDMEQLLLRILAIMPKELNSLVMSAETKVSEFITGEVDIQLEDSVCFRLPYKINAIFYLLADYYFKNRDFSKAIKYYTFDLAGNPTRFDSWAGMALSKASQIETKLNGLSVINPTNLLQECEDTLQCFEICIKLLPKQVLLWIEYGSLTYTIFSYCSRYLKHSCEKLSMEEFSFVEEKKEKMLNIAHHCFSLAATLQKGVMADVGDNSGCHEEKWLCQYMLGKITEKRKGKPEMYLNYYLSAANYLYESNATYPIKINHSNPTSLSVEALEVFYRTNSAIIKFLEHEKEITLENGNLFRNVLTKLSNSPFAFNKAKIDGNSLNVLKRKIVDKFDQATASKAARVLNDSEDSAPQSTALDAPLPIHKDSLELNEVKGENVKEIKVADQRVDVSKGSPTRRTSQESAVTGTTTTITSSNTSSSSSSVYSSSDSDSDSETSLPQGESKKRAKNLAYTADELKDIYNIIVCNLEECITRFPEHYKSIYRLAHHYMNGSEGLDNLNQCEQLLLGQYKTNLGNQINGLFSDRKNNNIFNGIWRIPSSEIDRPGSFSAHLVKCVSILIQLLMRTNNYNVLIDVGLQLYKAPDQDKRYITDGERIELYQQSITYCAQIIRNILKKNIENRNDEETLNLLIDVYKIYKKCLKYMNQREQIFTQLLIEAYKFYIQDKVDYIPLNVNYLDLAIKLCLQEITFRKNMEKLANTATPRFAESVDNEVFSNSPQLLKANRAINIPGLPFRSRCRSLGNTGAVINPFYGNTGNLENNRTVSALSPNLMTDMFMPPNLLSVMTLFESSNTQQKVADDVQRLFAGNHGNQSESEHRDTNIQSSLRAITMPNTMSFPLVSALEAIMKPGTSQEMLTITEKPKKVPEKISLDVNMKSCERTPTPRSEQPEGVELQPSQNTPTTLPSNPNQSRTTQINRSNPLGVHAYSAQSSFATFASPSLLDAFNMDNYNRQANLLTTYADLLRNTSLQEFHSLCERSALSRRQTKVTTSETHLPTSTVTSTAACSAATSLTTQAISQEQSGSSNPNSNIISSASTLPPARTATNTLSTSTSSFHLGQPQYSNLHPTPSTQTKTLQQKLAERQKANQLIESKASASNPTETGRKPDNDIIILD